MSAVGTQTEGSAGLPPSKEQDQQEAAPKGGGKKGKDKGKKPEASESKRSNLANQYPTDAPITVLVKENPKRPGSKAHARFELYRGCKTVGDFLSAKATHNGEEIKGTLIDIAYNVGRGFLKVG